MKNFSRFFAVAILVATVVLTACSKSVDSYPQLAASGGSGSSLQSAGPLSTFTAASLITTGTPQVSVTLMDGQSEGDYYLDTTIIYLDTAFTNSWYYTEGDRLAATGLRNQIAGLAGNNKLARDCRKMPSATTLNINTVPLTMYALDYQVYKIHFAAKNIPVGLHAKIYNSADGTSTPIDLSGGVTEVYVSFNPSAIPDPFLGLSIKFSYATL